MSATSIDPVHDATTRRRQLVAKRIRLARKRQGLSQERLALAIGVARVAVNAWENAHHSPGAHHLEQLAQALDEPVWFFYGGPSAHPPPLRPLFDDD